MVYPSARGLRRSAYECCVPCRRRRRGLVPRSAAARRPAPQAQSQPPGYSATGAGHPAGDAPAEARRAAQFQDTVVVTGTKGRGEDDRLGADDERRHAVRRSRPRRRPNFAELLRTIPGVNITQVSARDINVTSRAATGTLATGQLALLDGRTLYQDFFGFVMWDFLPVNFNEVKQIEVIRGPASAVWGANALYGVVNVISKTPREIEGHERHVRVWRLRPAGRPTPGRSGTSAARYADAPNDRWSYKLSGGGYSQDALARPTGDIPCDNSSGVHRQVGTGVYPPFSEHRHDAAEVRRARRLRLRGRTQALVLGRRRRDRRHHALGHRPVRHQQRVGDELREGQLHQGRPARRVLHQHPQRRCRPAADARARTARRSRSRSIRRRSTSISRTCRRSRSGMS